MQTLISETTLETEDEHIKLIALKVCSETGEVPNAVVTLRLNNQELTGDSTGGGVVDATLKAIEKLVQSNASLEVYSVNNVTNGTDAQGEVSVRLEKAGRIVNGLGADTDIVIASAKAYINALNKLLNVNARQHPQKCEV